MIFLVLMNVESLILLLTGATRHRRMMSVLKNNTQVASTKKYGVVVSPGLRFLLPYDSTTWRNIFWSEIYKLVASV